MTPDKESIQAIYQRLKPAQETLNYMKRNDDNFSNLNTNFQLMKKDITNICEKLDENSSDHKIMFQRIDDFIRSADEKYTKYTEFAFWRTVLVSGILLTIALGIIASYIEKIIN